MEYGLVLRWLLLYGVLFLAALPLARELFPAAPDDGAGFAFALATVVVTVVGFYLGHLRFGPWTALASVLVLAAVSGVALVRRRGRPTAASASGRRIAEAYGAFGVAFVLLALVRSYDPTMTPPGGEQFLHFGLYNAVLRAPSLPPEDMWFAGETIRYYFGLPTFNAVAAFLTDTDPEYAFNLAIAGYFASLVAATYSLGGWLARDWDHSRRAGALVTTFFVTLAGALVTPVRLLFGHLPRDLAVAYGRPVFGAIRHLDYEQAIAEQGSVEGWSWFFSRYVTDHGLHEVPLYSFVKADMHGHTHTIPALVLLAALGYAYYRTPETARWRRRGLLFGAVPLVGGYFGIANTWSLPIVVGMATLVALFAGSHPGTLLPGRLADRVQFDGSDTHWVLTEGWRTLLAGGFGGVVGALSVVLAGPFLFFHTPNNEGIGFLPPRTEAAGLLLVFGGPLLLFAAYLLTRAVPLAEFRPRVALGAAVGAPLLLVAGFLAGDLAFLVLVVPAVLAGWYLLRARRDVGYETVLLVAGLGLVVALQLVHARAPPWTQERWNTTLKVAIQAWVLCALAAGPIVLRLGGEVRAVLASSARTEASGTSTGTRAAAVAVAVLVAAVVLGSGTFTVLVAGQHLGDPVVDGEPSTLDGLSGHEEHRPAEMDAIRWLDDTASDTQEVLWMDRRTGTPTIVETPGYRTYDWFNPASTFTGLPTLAGWDHEQQYRGEETYTARTDQVDVVMTGDWERANRVLLDHDVQYLYVGPPANRYYGDDLRHMESHPALSVGYQNDEVTVFAVNQTRLERNPQATPD